MNEFNRIVAAVCFAVVLIGAGCACFSPAHKDDPACVVLHQTIDCTEGAIASYLPTLVPMIGDLINGIPPDKIDWAAVEQRAEKMGIKDGTCVIAALQNDFIHKTPLPSASKDMLLAHAAKRDHIVDMRLRWHTKHNLVGVKVKLKDVDGKVITL